ncbi:MAG: hypothetical protein SF187_03365 [Deltaproteobacteria bacterium]|nr:hypothetical protein [Deltaproteobacteria bacterium]
MQAEPWVPLLSRLAEEAFDWYRFDEDLPCARDLEVLSAFTALKADALTWEAAAKHMEVYAAHTVVSFAERCASWALTTKDVAHLERGLAAVALQWQGCEDPCDGIAVMGALYDASQRLGRSPETLFAATAACAPAGVGRAFADFLTRPDLNEIAKVMGYVVRDLGDKTIYLRSW